MTAIVRDERGLTLTEIMVVLVLATIVMTGIIGFYLNSQAVWFDGSSKVITQREVSLVLKSISDRARGSADAIVQNSPDANHVQIALTSTSGVTDSTYYYWWSAADSLIHEGYRSPAVVDRGPMLRSKVDRFTAVRVNSLLTIGSVRAYSPQGVRVDLATSVALVNR